MRLPEVRRVARASGPPMARVSVRSPAPRAAHSSVLFLEIPAGAPLWARSPEVFGGGAVGASRTEQQFKQAFSNCMRNRGHNVIN